MQPVCRFTNWFREHDTEVLSFVPITPGPVTLLSCPATDVNDRRAASRGGVQRRLGKTYDYGLANASSKGPPLAVLREREGDDVMHQG